MKRHLPIILILLLLAAGLTVYLATSGMPEIPPVAAALQPETSAAIRTDTAGTPAPLTSSAIAGMMVSGNEDSDGTVYSDPWLLQEFCSYLGCQKYTPVKDNGVPTYSVLLYGKDGGPLWEMSFGDDRVTFDKDITINGVALKKGTYQSDTGWPNDFSNFFLQLKQGKVINPQFLQYPAKITVPLNPSVVELCDRGNEKVNSYEVLPQLYEFIQSIYAGDTYEVTDGKVLHTYEEMQAEIARFKKETQCILLTYYADYSDPQYLLTHSGSQTYQGTTSGYFSLLAKDPQTTGQYTLITDWMVLHIKADSRFDSRFNAIFEANARGSDKLTPEAIQNLFIARKPHFLEYIGKNLGIPEWSGSEPERVEMKTSKLGTLNNLPYQVVSLSDPFSLRLLVFRNSESEPSTEYAGYMEFRGWPDEPGYTVKKTGNRIWIYGKQYMGHGTGESHYSQQWYTLSNNEIKPVLFYNYDDLTAGPYGGSSVLAKKVMAGNEKDMKITVQYDTSKTYHLFLEGSDDDGTVEFKGSKTAIFKWNESQQKFTSDFPEEDEGSFYVSPDTTEITKNCDKLLAGHAAELDKLISAIPEAKTEYESERKVWCYRTFLRDCTDCPEKDALLQKLQEILPEE